MIHKPVYRKKNKNLLQETTNTDLIIDRIPLKQVTSIKFLGVLINDKLTWDNHKQLVHSKISKTLGILYKCKDNMNDKKDKNVQSLHPTILFICYESMGPYH